MAKLTELKDRVTGEIILPKTVASNVYTSKGIKLTEELDKKANVEDLSNVLAEEVASDEVIEVINPTTIDEIKEEIAGGKLDKSVWDEYNEQFGLIGYYTFQGGFLPSQGYYNSGAIPLNHNEDLHLNIGKGGNFVSLIFLDINKKFVSSAFDYILHSDFTIEKSEYPQNSVYFVASTTLPNVVSYSNGVTFESREVAVSNVIEKSKYALFIDEWNAAWGAYGKYDPVNAPDAKHPFRGNDIYMTYEEAVYHLLRSGSENYAGDTISMYHGDKKLRTVTPIKFGSLTNVVANNMFFNCSNLQVVQIIGHCAPSRVNGMFDGCSNLREIRGVLQLDIFVPAVYFVNIFRGCSSLEEVKVLIKYDTSFEDSPKLSLASLRYLVDNSNKITSPITITVHPDVYAKLSNTSNTEWNKVLTDAAEKNITFITNG